MATMGTPGILVGERGGTGDRWHVGRDPSAPRSWSPDGQAAGAADRPTGPGATDALREVLESVRLTGGVFIDCRFTAPWCVSANPGPEDCAPLLSDPVQLIAYHYVLEGRMLVAAAGGAAIEVRAGETVLFARNDPHLMGSTVTARPVSAGLLIRPAEGGGLAQIVHGGGGEPTRFVCGFLGSNQSRNPLIATLPPILKVDMVRAGSSEWIEASLSFAMQGLREGRIGTSAVMSRLSELMFVEAVRGYAATLPAGQKGWLAGMRDPVVGRALALLHGRLSHPWTAEELAGEVALSRSAFSDRFLDLVGTPPMRYLTGWRMQVAQERLRAGQQPIARIAHEIGYDAEEAFARAFKREVGTPPAAWRRAVQAGH